MDQSAQQFSQQWSPEPEPVGAPQPHEASAEHQLPHYGRPANYAQPPQQESQYPQQDQYPPQGQFSQQSQYPQQPPQGNPVAPMPSQQYAPQQPYGQQPYPQQQPYIPQQPYPQPPMPQQGQYPQYPQQGYPAAPMMQQQYPPQQQYGQQPYPAMTQQQSYAPAPQQQPYQQAPQQQQYPQYPQAPIPQQQYPQGFDQHPSPPQQPQSAQQPYVPPFGMGAAAAHVPMTPPAAPPPLTPQIPQQFSPSASQSSPQLQPQPSGPPQQAQFPQPQPPFPPQQAQFEQPQPQPPFPPQQPRSQQLQPAQPPPFQPQAQTGGAPVSFPPPPNLPKVRDAFLTGAGPFLQPGEQVFYGFILKLDSAIEETPEDLKVEIAGQHHVLGDIHRASDKMNKGMKKVSHGIKWAANPLDAFTEQLTEKLADKANEALTAHLAGPVFVGGWESQAGWFIRYVRATSEEYGPGAYGAVTNQRYLVFRGARVGGSAMSLVYAVPRTVIAGVRLENGREAIKHGRTPRAELHFSDGSMVATMMPGKQAEQMAAVLRPPTY